MMTSPNRKRSDRSRKRLADAESLEIVERARRCLVCSTLPPNSGGYGATCAPLSRSDCVLIGRAVREGWDVPKAKRRSIMRQMMATLETDDARLILSVARLALAMDKHNMLVEAATAEPG